MRSIRRLSAIAVAIASCAFLAAPAADAAVGASVSSRTQNLSTTRSHDLAIAKEVFSSKTPLATFLALGKADKAAFLSAETPTANYVATRYVGLGRNSGRTVRQISAAPTFSGCWAAANSGGARSAIGITLYTYGHSVEVCVSSGRVYYVTVYNQYFTVNAPGWREDHYSSKTENVGWEGRGLTQWEFILGIAGYDVEHTYPCLQIRLNANGHSLAGSASCNLS
jgi:hypothetical protein